MTKKVKFSKKLKNMIRYGFLLAAAIFFGFNFITIAIIDIAILLGFGGSMSMLDIWNGLTLCINGVAFLVFVSYAYRYKPFNLNARRQRQKISKYLSLAKTFEEDEQERIIINLILEKSGKWASRFSPQADPMLNAEVAEYLESRLSMLPSVQEFVLHVRCNESIDKQEKELFRNSVRKYYAAKYTIFKTNQGKTMSSSIWMIVFGIVVLSISMMLLTSDALPFTSVGIDTRVMQKICEIIGTVFIWEATYILFVHRLPALHQRMRYLMLANMEILFVDSKSQK